MKPFANKRILFIAAKFFAYDIEIKKRLTQLGAHVDYFDQRPSNSFMTKAIIRINKKLLSYSIDRYYKRIIDEIRNVKYDYVLFISPEAITRNSFLALKRVQPDANYVLYMWDSVKNKGRNVHDIISFFDTRYSFDKTDCLNPNWNIRFRPVFFLNDYATVKEDMPREFDFLFVGTIHSDRYRLLSQLKRFCINKRLSYYYYMFFPSRLLFYLRQLIDHSLRGAPMAEFRFVALGKNEIIELMGKSTTVIDIHHPGQTGLTMRTIEVLGAKRKLITTNKDIVNYDFYSPNNILLVDRENIQIDMTFFQTRMTEVPPDVYYRYSIDGWISDILDIDNVGRPTSDSAMGQN